MADNTLNKKKTMSFSEIAMALANDYESIYVIDSKDNSYVEYLTEGDEKKLVKRRGGIDFFKDVPRESRELIHPEDQEQFIESLKKERVLANLKNEGSFSLNYRLIINGRPYYYFLKTINTPDDNIIIGVRNVDEQVKRELIADRDRQMYQRIAKALASRYEAIYYINIKSNAYIRYSASKAYDKLGMTKEGDDFFEDMTDDLKKFLHEDDFRFVNAELQKDNLLRHLKENGSISLTYRQKLGDNIVYVTLIIISPKNNPDHILMALMNVDAQMRREQAMLLESDMFNEVALALASRYEVIYRVNIETNEYYEYSASDKYSKLVIGDKGIDFFADTQNNMKRDIYHEDYHMMAKAMAKETLLDNLSKSNKVFLNYRLLLDGKPQYVSLVAMRQHPASKHIIVAVENIDAAKRKELEFEAAIGTAIDMANRDSLTGVKNKHAYVNAEMQLDTDIQADLFVEFAIAVCDINGLKDVNDNQGHSAGDKYIKDACAIICEIFDHSPVFRIGGDEFVVLLRGSDYKNRHNLFKQFARKQQENKKAGLVTLAYGMSEYDPDNDLRVQDVMERADNLMYDNKRRFKAGLSDDDDITSEESYSFVRFYELYEKLLAAFVSFDHPDVPLIESLLIKIAKMFRLAKGVTYVFKNKQEEADGTGETFCCFDLGVKCHEILSIRVNTSVMSGASMKIYMAYEEPPLDVEEKEKVELVARTVLSFISRNRLKDMVYDLAFFDEAGYPNIRSWNRHMLEIIGAGNLREKMIVRYNLRHFALINQEYGRLEGDRVMKKHFETLKYLIGPDGFIARLGGDNFVFICPLENKESVLDYLSEAPIRINEMSSVKLSTSAGVFVIPDDYTAENHGDIMGKITNACRIAQTGGKDHIVFYDDSFMAKKERSMRVQQEFPDALRKGEFRPFYQPKVNILTGELTGAEALCRWFRNYKIVPPFEFIPPLEQTSDICKLDMYMLECVCRDMRRWIDEGRRPITVSVNFSRKNIMNIDLPVTIERIIDSYQIPHEYIEIELTETTTDVEFSDLKRVVGALHDKGIRTSIDDFGIGYSSLNLLRDIPWNVIKIDRSFLPTDEDTGENEVRKTMFGNVVSLANSLGMETVAEGVETECQIDVMKENGCLTAQGYFYDKPLPVDEFEDRLDKGSYEQ